MPSEIVFVINAPPLSFNKSSLYDSEFFNHELNPIIKSISDTFFLSNDFRKHYIVYFLTKIEGEPYQIVFKGDKLRFLGPSFFSAGHLLLRAKNHILYPNSKKGKLTPGLFVKKEDLDWIQEKYKESKWFYVQSTNDSERSNKIDLESDSIVFLFGFETNNDFKIQPSTLLLKSIELDEQIILTNYLLERELS